MDKLPLQPIVLCGGSGSRLWPLSRESFPKQFLNLTSNNSKSLLQNTILRLGKLKNVEAPILICNEKHRFIVAEQMRDIDIKPKSIILEHEGKNTAPAAAIGTIKSRNEFKNSILLILAADHFIQNVDKFIEVIEVGYKTALSGKLVTFGIIPLTPETGFGYIESTEKLSDEIKPSSIKRFIEKPDIQLAKKFIVDKHFSWNSGMFMFKVNTIIDEFKKYAPEILNLCINALDSAEEDLDFLRLNRIYFSKCQEISIDKAIMEKTSLGSVLLLNAGWSDIGSWDALWKNEIKDKNGNFIKGKVISENIKNCYVKSENRIIACLGVDDLIIIENSDSVLISKKSDAQKVKSIVQRLDEEGFEEAKSHKLEYRPWGNYISIAEDKRWQVKKITVKPGSSLSLQLHHHRSEHWIVVKGTALVEIDETNKLLSENESIYIPLGCKHRLTNPGKLDLILIEVQSGSYLGEDDIYRFKDDYGR